MTNQENIKDFCSKTKSRSVRGLFHKRGKQEKKKEENQGEIMVKGLKIWVEDKKRKKEKGKKRRKKPFKF